MESRARPGAGGTGAGAPVQGLAELLDRSPDLLFLLDGEGRFRYVSDAARHLLGQEPSEWIGRSGFEILHPDDVGLAAESLVTSAESGPGVKRPLVLRARHRDGSWRDLEIVANHLADGTGGVSLLVSARDLTSRDEARTAAENDQRRFEQVFEQAPIGMALVALDGRLTRVNAALARMAGRPPHALLRMSVLDLVVPGDRDRLIQRARRALAGEVPGPTELRTARPDGRLTWVRVSSTIVRDDHGTPLHGIAHLEDVTEQRLLREELEHRARHDVLTDALNRDGFAVHARRAVADGVPVGVVAVDLDGFKRVNDDLGHAAGDELLVAVTARLRGTVKSTDAVARFGGDEFVLLLTDVDPARLAEVAERVRQALGQPFALRNGTATVTGSIGTSMLGPGEQVEAAMARADAAAYRAKRRGGDGVHRDGDGPHRDPRSEGTPTAGAAPTPR